MTTTILGYVLLGALLVSVLGAIYSTGWYAVRRNVWPGVETAKLPLGARIAQAVAELLTNLPGALRAVAASAAPPAPPEGRS